MSEKLPPGIFIVIWLDYRFSTGTRCVVCDDIATGNHYSVSFASLYLLDRENRHSKFRNIYQLIG